MFDSEVLPCLVYREETPDGTLFVNIMEAENQPGAARAIKIHIGKGGAPLLAWAEALSQIMTLALRSGLTLQALQESVSNISSDRLKKIQGGVSIRSGPEGVAYALMKYQQNIAKLFQQGIEDEVDDGSIEEG